MDTGERGWGSSRKVEKQRGVGAFFKIKYLMCGLVIQGSVQVFLLAGVWGTGGV